MRDDVKRLEAAIIKGIIVVLAAALGAFGGGVVLAVRDPSLSWQLFFLVPACVVVLWLARGAFGVLRKDYS